MLFSLSFLQRTHASLKELLLPWNGPPKLSQRNRIATAVEPLIWYNEENMINRFPFDFTGKKKKKKTILQWPFSSLKLIYCQYFIPTSFPRKKGSI